MNEEIKIANRTARSSGAVGKNALVPRWIKSNISKDKIILDFGCGPKMMHVKMLKKEGFEHVDGYDFGNNVTEGHIEKLEYGFYDVVYASNVFNTHISESMTRDALNLIRYTLKENSPFIFNMPKSPNYFWYNKMDLFRSIFSEVFGKSPEKYGEILKKVLDSNPKIL
jgi:hypothetical protein